MNSQNTFDILNEKMHTYAQLTENYMKKRTDLFYQDPDFQNVFRRLKPAF